MTSGVVAATQVAFAVVAGAVGGAMAALLVAGVLTLLVMVLARDSKAVVVGYLFFWLVPPGALVGAVVAGSLARDSHSGGMLARTGAAAAGALVIGTLLRVRESRHHLASMRHRHAPAPPSPSIILGQRLDHATMQRTAHVSVRTQGEADDGSGDVLVLALDDSAPDAWQVVQVMPTGPRIFEITYDARYAVVSRASSMKGFTFAFRPITRA